MRRIALLMHFISFAVCTVNGQTTRPNILNDIDTSKTYLFYLHGQISIENGKGISKYFGIYEYQSILDTFSSYGYKVISEPRPINADDGLYSAKVSMQIDTLLKAGVNPAKIIVVGASAGAYITIDVAIRLKNKTIKYAILGMCESDTYKSYQGKELCGNFLSIYESSDLHGSCKLLFSDKRCITSIKEIKLNMNNSHAFLYKPYKEWVDPLVKWINMTN
ncbi:MAG TPA: hypothetical protein VNV35_07115 [Puia sp.]|jgi:hypothetical protein|nr:hypothetical protein [Puia sp.]